MFDYRASFPASSLALAFAVALGGCNGNGSSTPTGGSDGGAGMGGPDLATAGDMALALGTAIQAPKNTWTWIDFPDSVCDDGTPTGIGVYLTDSKNLMVFLNGGGACWDYSTCVQLNTSTHGPFGKSEFDQLNVGAAQGSILGTQASSPMHDWNKVYVPYCTGDVHAGDNVATYKNGSDSATIHHKGHANILAFLKRLAPTFPAPDKFLWTGASAGGFGAAINYDTARSYFAGAKESYLLDDSGPPLVGDDIRDFLRAAWFMSWNLDASFGALCPDCTSDFSAFIPILVARYPKDRMALLSSTQDQTIRGFYFLSPQLFQAALYRMATMRLDPTTNFHYFFETGSFHTMEGNLMAHTSQGVNLNDWITQLVGDDPAWKSVAPPAM